MGMYSRGADKEELGKGGRPLERVRRDPELHWSLTQSPGWAWLSSCQWGLSLLVSSLEMARLR